MADNKKINIYHISPAFGPNGGGISEVVNNICQFNTDFGRTFCYGNYKIPPENIKCSYKKISFSSILLLWFRILFKKNERHIFHLHGAWSTQFTYISLVFLFKLKNTKMIFQPHGLLANTNFQSKSSFKKKLANLTYQGLIVKRADSILANSSFEIHSFIPSLIKVNDKRNVVISNGISQMFHNKFRTVSERKNKLLFLSQITPVKGIEQLINTIKYIYEKFEVLIPIDIYGYGIADYIMELNALVESEGLTEAISFKGPVSFDEKSSLYNDYEYFILPSESESFGLVVLEALSMGCKVLTTINTPWDQHYYKDMISIYDPTAESAANKVLNFYMDKNQSYGHESKILSNRQYIQDNFIWESLIKSLHDLYRGGK